eukprot:GEMP01044480.1.p1 GENE.GEMP01044480.1~~GEMP01044480.1.p1  ORF type:complete len:458 (+),score=86.78 GEMP01044480.1:52-1425(+)
MGNQASAADRRRYKIENHIIYHKRDVPFLAAHVKSFASAWRTLVLCAINDGFLGGDVEGGCSLWRTDYIDTVSLHRGPLRVLIVREPSTLISGGAQGVKIWTFSCERQFVVELVRHIPSYEVATLQVDDQTRIFASFLDFHAILCWDMDGKLLTTYYGHKVEGVRALKLISPTEFCSGGDDGVVRWWDVPEEEFGVCKSWASRPTDAQFRKASVATIPPRTFIRVYIDHAEDVPIMDVVGKCDPYIKIEAIVERDGKKEVFQRAQTSVCEQTLNPFWKSMLEIDVAADVDMSHISVKLIMYDKDFLKTDDCIGEIDVFWSATYKSVQGPEFSCPDPTSIVPVAAVHILPGTTEERRLAVAYEDGCVFVFTQQERLVMPVLRVDTHTPGLSCFVPGKDGVFVGGDPPRCGFYDLSWRRRARFKLHDGRVDTVIVFESGLVVAATHSSKRMSTMISLWN